MCEILAVAAETPQKLGSILSWAVEVERLGIAGFGWGVAWGTDGGGLQSYRNPTSVANDVEGMLALRDTPFRSAVVHLRRPSRLSTVEIADTQPFLDEEGRFAFVHNGQFRHDGEQRERFRGLLRGRADSEVGFRLFGALLEDTAPAPALAAVHGTLGGTANLCCMLPGGELLLYGGHHGNALYRFRLGEVRVASTALHSDDDSLFDLVFPSATERELIRHEPIPLNL
jgi:glutamine amidotransferase class II-like protein